jgi:hypothetical protein
VKSSRLVLNMASSHQESLAVDIKATPVEADERGAKTASPGSGSFTMPDKQALAVCSPHATVEQYSDGLRSIIAMMKRLSRFQRKTVFPPWVLDNVESLCFQVLHIINLF